MTAPSSLPALVSGQAARGGSSELLTILCTTLRLLLAAHRPFRLSQQRAIFRLVPPLSVVVVDTELVTCPHTVLDRHAEVVRPGLPRLHATVAPDARHPLLDAATSAHRPAASVQVELV